MRYIKVTDLKHYQLKQVYLGWVEKCNSGHESHHILKSQHLGEFSTPENLACEPRQTRIQSGLPTSIPAKHRRKGSRCHGPDSGTHHVLGILYSPISAYMLYVSHAVFVVDLRDTNHREQNNLYIIQTEGSSQPLTVISWPWRPTSLLQWWSWWANITSDRSQVYHGESESSYSERFSQTFLSKYFLLSRL